MAIRRPSTITRFGVLLLLGLVSGCTCLYSAEVVNDTDAPLFANLSYDWRGERWDSQGVLVPPRGRTELSSSPPDFLRVRDLSGNTVAFQHLTESEDTRLVVDSLEPLSNPVPLGVPAGIGNEGLSTKSRAVICRNGHEEEIPFFRMTVTIRSDLKDPLIVSGFEPFSDRRVEEEEIRGVLLPPLGEARLHLEIVEEGWITAFDARSTLVFTEELPREPFPLVTIPSSLPPEPEVIPALELARSTGSGTDCSPFTVRNFMLVGVAVAAMLLFGVTVWGVWRWRRRRLGSG